MPETENASLIEMTVEVVTAYVTKNHVRAAELAVLISTVHASLAGMGSEPVAEPEPDRLVPPVSIKKSITDEYLVSMEDGKHYRSLNRHLSVRGMTPDEYRAKWGLPRDYPMVAPAYAKARSELAKSFGLGSQRRKH